MTTVKLYNQQAEAVGEAKLSDKVFALKLKADLVHQAVITQQANERKVIANTLGRAEVRGGGKKPWKQKGTGRARSGSSRSPIWIGGGVTFGPLKDRNFTKKLNKKMKTAALCMVLSDKLASSALTIVDTMAMTEYKTKNFNAVISAIETKVLSKEKKAKRSVLVVIDQKQSETFISGRNLAGVQVLNLENINIVDLLKYKNLVLTSETVKKLEETYAK